MNESTLALDGFELALFDCRLHSICEEMAAALKRSAFSPNIRDRLDFSCAIFDHEGRLLAQSDAIPVHLGSMAFAVRDAIGSAGTRGEGQLVFNHPAFGGTHLPDVTVVKPVESDGRLIGYVANRAHHADIGCDRPGSMPLSQRLSDEGIVLEPAWYANVDQLLGSLTGLTDLNVSRGDFGAQFSANKVGVSRLQFQIESDGIKRFRQSAVALNEYARKLATQAVKDLPSGQWTAHDWLESEAGDIRIGIELWIADGRVVCDFSTSDDSVECNLNCPPSVVAAGVFFVFRCLMPGTTPNCAGAMDCIEIITRPGSLMQPEPNAAVAAGNVETSMRVTDVVIAALSQAAPERFPAAGPGTMNNLAMGSRSAGQRWNYYETMAGGHGATANHRGADGVQAHMTNTLNTPIEILEQHYPLQVMRYAIRHESGGEGRHRGGHGLIREFKFLAPASVTLLTDRRSNEPPGACGGQSGKRGQNSLNDRPLPGRCQIDTIRGDRLRIETPGGGGWGGQASGGGDQESGKPRGRQK